MNCETNGIGTKFDIIVETVTRRGVFSAALDLGVWKTFSRRSCKFSSLVILGQPSEGLKKCICDFKVNLNLRK